MFSFFKKKNSQTHKLCYEVDLHSHILPGIDDGSPNTEKSIGLIREMQNWGIRKIIATPHIAEETFENTPETIKNAWDLLKTALKSEGIEQEICYSAEYRIDDGFIRMFESNQLIPLPDNYLLVENSFIQAFWNLDELLFQLQLKEFKPILAHPERYAYYHNQKNIYTTMHNNGCAFQLNLLSFYGYYGKSVKEAAFWLAEQGYIDFLGTDLHNMNHVQAISNFLTTKDYTKLISKINIKNDMLK